MKRLAFSILPLITAASLLAAAPPKGFHIWSPAQLAAMNKKMIARMKPGHDGISEKLKPLADNHLIMLAYHNGDGGAEVHEKFAHIFVIEAGRGTLVVGGRLHHAKEVSPGEWRAVSIDGGAKVPIAKGDIINIPPNTPHQILVKPGTDFIYFVVNIHS